MRLWLRPSAELSLHDQLVRQISLGILSGELSPGERLPSVRAVARRFSIHANTVSAAYRELARQQWVESRHGSGVYVRQSQSSAAGEPQSTGDTDVNRLLDQLAKILKSRGLDAGATIADLHGKLHARRDYLLVEPDPELARIVQFEIEAATGYRIPHSSLNMHQLAEAWQLEPAASRPVIAVLPSKAEAARSTLASLTELRVLRIGPVAASLASQLPESLDHLVAIVSRWPQFVDIARQMLLSTGFAPEALMLRSPADESWERGLEEAAAVLCDSATAVELPRVRRRIIFHLLAAESLRLFEP